MTARPLAGRQALVTGASGGVGAAAATALAAAGATVVITGRDPAALERLAARVGAVAAPADLTAPEQPAALVAAAGPVDLLVHCAGRGWYGELAAMPPEEAERLLALDLLAPLRLVRALLPSMLDAGRGSIVLVGSIAGRVGVPGEVVYTAAKAGLHGYAEALRYEVGRSGVQVIEVVPGAVDTAFFRRRGAAYQRSWPRPEAPEVVGAALVRAVVAGRPEVFVPRWLELPVRLSGAAPSLYRRLAARAMDESPDC